MRQMYLNTHLLHLLKASGNELSVLWGHFGNEGIQKTTKNETFSETTFLLVGGEHLDGGTLVACKN